MKFAIEIEVMPRKELLDPQGKAVTNGLHNIGSVSYTHLDVYKRQVFEK